ncbi:alpha/beta hydrolase domain-containing protein [Paenarthrobacter sp. NPDC057981]|uniref:alpha/beta hydrolase domain-containing protein n=1 Tax=Paenarthrobacter sp. NPDC057981 TaxID=3346297 RepID=UPI0036DF3A46
MHNVVDGDLTMALTPNGLDAPRQGMMDSSAELVAGSVNPISAVAWERRTATPPLITALPGNPVLPLGEFDYEKRDYQVDEFIVSGAATSFTLCKPARADGQLVAAANDSAKYVTRYVVVRPSASESFNGTVFVEWLNVTSGADAPVTWMGAHREILRSGSAWVGVSAQKAGIVGDESVPGMALPLTKVDSGRYGKLLHPGDSFAFDMFSQAAEALKSDDLSNQLLGDLVAQRVIGVGQSQSAVYLTTYVNAVDPRACAYDGFLVHSRMGPGASLSANQQSDALKFMPKYMPFRADLRVPVLCLVTETDLVGSTLSGYAGARRSDTPTLRVWEVPGTAHVDGYLLNGALVDNGKVPYEQFARLFRPSTTVPSIGVDLAKPYNSGEAHHYVLQAGVRAIDLWLRTGQAPVSTLPIKLTHDGGEFTFDADDIGIAKGGVRTPWTDVPTTRLSGVGNSGGFIGSLVGVSELLTSVELEALYPGGKADYLMRFTASTHTAITMGHLLVEDRAEILAIADINYQGVP